MLDLVPPWSKHNKKDDRIKSLKRCLQNRYGSIIIIIDLFADNAMHQLQMPIIKNKTSRKKGESFDEMKNSLDTFLQVF